jgi:hypothetical protein
LSLASYWMLFVGVALAVLVLLTIFSTLVMAHWQEEDQDRLEIDLLQGKNFPSYIESNENLISSGTSSIARPSHR